MVLLMQNYLSFQLCQDQYEILALTVLMEYLTDTSVAPLQRDFVELDDPYCSRVSLESVTYHSDTISS